MVAKRTELARARKRMGYSQEKLAELLQVDASSISNWERGKTEPIPYKRPKLAKLLGITRDELDDLLAPALGADGRTRAEPAIHLAEDASAYNAAGLDVPTTSPVHADAVAEDQIPGGDPTNRRDALRVLGAGMAAATGLREQVLGGYAAPSASGSVTPALADELRAISASYRRAYQTAPAQQLYSSAHAHMRLALSLQPGDQPAAIRAQLLVTAGEMAAMSATILGLDLGRWADAGPYLDLANRAARESTDVELETVVLACQAFRAAYGLADKQLGLDFAEAAVTASRQGACNITRGWVVAVASERQADVGNPTASRQRLDDARTVLSAPPNEQSWSGIGSFGLAKLAAYEGGNYRRLGDYRKAVRALDTALVELDPSMRRHRATALIDRAEAHHGAGHIDAACSDTRTALTIAAETQHAETVYRAEKIARATLTTNSRDANQLWNDVLALKATTRALAY